MKRTVLIILLLQISTVAYAKDPIRTSEGVSAKISDGEPVKVKEDFGTNLQHQLYSVDTPKADKTIRIKEEENNLVNPYSEKAYKEQINKIDTRSNSYVLTEEERKLLNNKSATSYAGYNILFKILAFILFGIGVGGFIKIRKKKELPADCSSKQTDRRYCPKCGTEYHHEISSCPDCQIDLVQQS